MIWQQQRNQERESPTFHKQDLAKAEKLRSKSLYKIFLIILKYTPFLLALIDITFTVLSYFSINCYFLSCIGGVSLIFIGLLYILSYLFQFCYLYRLPLHYITATNVLALVDNSVGLPFAEVDVYRLYLIILGIFMFTFIYKSIKNNDKHHKKSVVVVR